MADSLDDIKIDLAEPSGNQTYDQVNPFEGFLRSAASSATLEMFGHEPPEAVQGFRAEHPALGLLSSFAGIGGAYGAAFKGLETLPKYNAMLDLAGEGNTMLSGAGRAGLGMGTVEAGRIAGAAATGGDVPQTAEEGAFDTGAALGLGGLGGLFRSAGKTEPSLKRLGLDIDMKEPPQVHLKAMKDALAEGTIAESDQPSAHALVGDLKDAVLGEELGKEFKYVSDLDTGDAQPINRLFKTGGVPEGSTPDVVRKRYLVTGRDFPDAVSAEEGLQAAGLSDNLDAIQFPRSLAFNSKNGAKSVESEIKNNLTSIGPGEFLGKEPDGLYVMAKKLVGEVGSPDPSDRWTIFKTHDPKLFSTNADFADKVAERNAWLADKPLVPDPANPKDILDETQQMYEQLPMKGYYQASKEKSVAGVMGKLGDMVGLKGENEITNRMKSLVRETFAPAMYEYKNNPRASYIFAHSRAAFQKAEAIAHAMTFGDEGLEKSSSIWGKLLKGVAPSGRFGSKEAFADILKPLSKSDLHDVLKAWDKQLYGTDLDKAIADREISSAAGEALKKIDPLDEYLIDQTKKTQAATGAGDFSPIKGHYMLPRTWQGDWRVPLFSDTGKMVYVASGKTKLGAEELAKRILGDKEVKGWYAKDPFLADSDTDFDLAQQVRYGSPEYLTAAALKNKVFSEAARPQSFKVRTGVQGYQTEFTKDELTRKFYDTVLRRNRYIAELSVKKVLGSDMAKLGVSDKRAFDSIMRRMNSMAGRQGEVSKAINDISDRVFAPALGKNSASAIARTVNRTMHHLTLGSFNLQQPVVNAMTFMQTVLPRVAFTLNASDSSLHQAYSWLPVIDKSGVVKGSMGWLEPFRIMKQSIQRMKNPGEELSSNFSRALREGTVDPKFIEEWVGQNSKQASSLKETLKGEQPWPKFLEALSNYLPSTSEKLSRGNAFVVGHILGEGLNLKGDGLYRFAKEFTEKTMYNYSTFDRPRVFTGPTGSVFGQFKNWTMHYLGNMLEYADEGFSHNNWAPLMWQMGGTSALGGLSATAMWPAADLFSKWLTNKSAMENLYARMGGGSGDSTTGNLADSVYMGMPMFLGLSINGSVADPLSDPSRNAAQMFSFVQMNRAIALGKALGSSWDNWKMTGQHPVDSEATRDLLISALAPKVFARIASQTADDGIKSLNNGGKIISGMNLAEKMMYDSGYMPKRVALAHDVNERLWQEQDEMKNKVQTMGRLWHDAEAANAYEVLTDLNNSAMVSGIPIDRVISSAKSLDRIETTPQLERKFKPQDLMRFENLNVIGGN